MVFPSKGSLFGCALLLAAVSCQAPTKRAPGALDGGMQGTATAAAASTADDNQGDTEPAPPMPKLAFGVQGEDEPESKPAAPAASPATTVAYVAGEPIDVRELLAHWMHRDSRTVYDFADRLVTGRLALAEAQRLGIALDPTLVDAGVVEARNVFAERLGGVRQDVDRYLLEQLGLDPTRYFDLVRDETVQQLLSERAVRTWTLSNDRADVAVIVVATPEDAALVTERLKAGEPFAQVASEASLDPSGAAGGLLPPVIKSELSSLSRLAFNTPVGDWGGPIDEQGKQIFIQTLGFPTTLVGNWQVIGEAVEADLEARPVEDPEYWQWRSAMGRRYEIDMRPLFDLLGEPQGQ
ncbi:MAG: hypothetical protein ACI9D0_000059 [Bacteroidia bacterium]|jgi:hypothetical protein